MRWALLLTLWAAPTWAFTIETALSEGCHERITLGAVGVGAGASGTAAAREAVLARLVEGAADALPTDRLSRAFVADLARRYGFADRSPTERWVLASLVAGARAPDTRSHSLASLNDLRTTHAKDEYQARHALRRAGDDGVAGNAPAIAAARAFITAELAAAHAARWGVAAEAVDWSFPFYRPTDVQVFGPSYHLGVALHTTQDAFTHTLRDERLQILSVLNFADAIRNDYDEARDGVAHSDRLDTCDEDDAYDALRVRAAAEASAMVVEAALAAFARPDFATAPTLAPALDGIFAYQPGCDLENDYCAFTWLAEARKEPTTPINLLLCASTEGAPPALWWLGLAVLVAGRRRRRR